LSIITKTLMTIRKKIVHIIPEDSRLFRWLSLIGLRINAKKSHKPLTTLLIGVFATDHCNLNCKCCTAFSPIATPSFLDIGIFQKDIARLATLTSNKLESFIVTGGEPLLHPRLIEIFTIAHAFFPDTKLGFMTNGTLLTQMPDSFWEKCHHLKININISRYPINLDISKIQDIADKHNAMLRYVGGNDTPIKTMWKYPLDLSGKQPLSNSYDICTQINRCITLKDGKLYPCSAIAGAEIFNKYFGTNLEVNSNDVLDIYSVKDINEIFDFCCSPKPFCKYCNRKGVVFGIPYGQSERDISEWT